MQLDPQVAELVGKICSEWDRAERAIKVAEQVIGEDPFPSIKELRYAGRRFVEAFNDIDGSDGAKASELLQDAYFDCMRAKHDAMDVAINEIAGRVRYSQKDLGAGIVVHTYPKITSLVACLSKFENLIADSREKREIRDAIYTEIQENFDTVVELYDEFKANEGLMKALADEMARKKQELLKKDAELASRSRIERNISYGITIIGIIVAVLIAIFLP
jgi:hypothetical protein